MINTKTALYTTILKKISLEILFFIIILKKKKLLFFCYDFKWICFVIWGFEFSYLRFLLSLLECINHRGRSEMSAWGISGQAVISRNIKRPKIWKLNFTRTSKKKFFFISKFLKNVPVVSKTTPYLLLFQLWLLTFVNLTVIK